MNSKYNVNAYIIMYLIGYSFYFHQVYTQILYSKIGLQFIIPFLIAYALFPIFFLYVTKKISYKFNFKIDFIYKILTILYLFLNSLIVINYASVMIHNYYYQDTNSLIVCFFLLLPILYACIKGSKIYHSLVFFICLIFIGFKLLYGLNPNTYDIYPLYNTLYIKDYIEIIVLSISLIIEPVILLGNKMITSKINPKIIFSSVIIISFISIYSLLREVSEFGLLLNTLSFPYYESCKLITFESNFDNIDYYYIFSLATSLFSRVPLTFLIIKDTFDINKKWIFTIFFVFFLLLYVIVRKLELYNLIIMPLFYICSFILITLFIITFFLKEKKHE